MGNPHIIATGEVCVNPLFLPFSGQVKQSPTLPICCRFAINLVKQSSGMKCVFHFDSRFDQNQTVRNTDFHGSWGPEERSPLPLARNRNFNVEIRCLPDRCMVSFLR